MTELAYYPKTLIALVCNLAKSRVFLRDDLPFYVRDEDCTWTAHCNIGNYRAQITAPDLDKLQTEMERWYEQITRKD